MGDVDCEHLRLVCHRVIRDGDRAGWEMACASELPAVFHGGHLRRVHDVLFVQLADVESGGGWAVVSGGSELRVVAGALPDRRLAGPSPRDGTERDKRTLK